MISLALKITNYSTLNNSYYFNQLSTKLVTRSNHTRSKRRLLVANVLPVVGSGKIYDLHCPLRKDDVIIERIVSSSSSSSLSRNDYITNLRNSMCIPDKQRPRRRVNRSSSSLASGDTGVVPGHGKIKWNIKRSMRQDARLGLEEVEYVPPKIFYGSEQLVREWYSRFDDDHKRAVDTHGSTSTSSSNYVSPTSASFSHQNQVNQKFSREIIQLISMLLGKHFPDLHSLKPPKLWLVDARMASRGQNTIIIYYHHHDANIHHQLRKIVPRLRWLLTETVEVGSSSNRSLQKLGLWKNSVPDIDFIKQQKSPLSITADI